MELLVDIFRGLLYITGSLILIMLIASIIMTPFKKIKMNKAKKELLYNIKKSLDEACEELRKEIEKQEAESLKNKPKTKKNNKKEEK